MALGKGFTVVHIQGSTFDAHSPVESYSLLYLNPPYDDEVHDDRSRRSEAVFLEHCFRWLMPKGVLILVIPAQRVNACNTILASHFRDVAMYRLADPERWAPQPAASGRCARD